MDAAAHARSRDEEYRQFYQYLAHDFTDPLAWSHNKVEGKREYTSLLYLPGRAPFDLWQREAARGLKLYVRRVFIMDDAEQFLPLYLRFIKGVVDSSDLPLNVSRELLQQEPEVEAIRSGLTKRVLDMLARLAKDEPEKYATFWKEFGAVLKEGVGPGLRQPRGDPAAAALCQHPRGRRHPDGEPRGLRGAHEARPGAHLLRHRRERGGGARQPRHRAAQGARPGGAAARRAHRRVGAWGRSRASRASASRTPRAATSSSAALASEADRKQHDAELKESKGLLKRIKDALGERVTEVRVSERLTDSPACLVLGEHDLAEQHAAHPRGGGPEGCPRRSRCSR